jgi:hypothetical protein
MKLPTYELRADASLINFEFTSEGRKGCIEKEIVFERISLQHVYNLVFGDKCKATGSIDDRIVTGNGDTEKVLATVAAAVIRFLTRYSEASVYATGSTDSRNRMYRMGIARYFEEVPQAYHVLGETSPWEFEPFEKNKNYIGFVITLKSSKFNI